MQDLISTQNLLPIDPDVPAPARDLAERVAAEQTEQEESAAEKRSRRATELVTAVRQQVRDLFEGDAYLRFRHLLWTERMRVRDRLLPPDGLTADFDDLHRDRKARADAFLREQGVAPERLATLLSEQRAGLADVLGEPYAQSTGTVRHTGPHEPHAAALDTRAFAIRPPFSGFQQGFHFANLTGSGFRGDQLPFLVPPDGLVGHQVHLINDDASDFDFGETVADSQIAFWFQPALSGRVNMTIEAQCVTAAHTLHTEDEWGWSDSSTTQTNFLMMHVLHPNISGPSFAPTSNFVWQTAASQDVFRQFIPGGTTVVGQLSTSGAIPAGQPVLVRAGTRTINSSFTNDVVIHSTPDFRWLIRMVAIQMVP